MQPVIPAGIEAPPSAGYVTKLNAAGSALLWSTYFGDSGGKLAGSSTAGDSIIGMAVDGGGNILIAGFAYSADLPGLWNTPVALRPPPPANGVDPLEFVGRLSPDGSAISPTELVGTLPFFAGGMVRRHRGCR